MTNDLKSQISAAIKKSEQLNRVPIVETSATTAQLETVRLANLRQIAALPKNDASWTVSEYWEAFDAVALAEFSEHIL